MTKQSAERIENWLAIRKKTERKIEVKKWLAIRKKAGRKIDPKTAEIVRVAVQVLDPYGIYPDLPEECYCVGRDYFARAPGSDIWVWFGDLPAATARALWKNHKARPAFVVFFKDGANKILKSGGNRSHQSGKPERAAHRHHQHHG